MLRKLAPLADRVLVKKLVPMTKTASGILLPESSQPKANEGEVIAVGPGFTTKEGTLIPVSVKVGDKVLLPDYGGALIKIGDEEGFLYRGDEILAKYL